MNRNLLPLILFSVAAMAQPWVPKYWVVKSVGAAATRPAACTANKDVFVCSGSGCSPNPSLEFCTSANTFTAFSGGGSGTVTSVDAGNGVETVSGSAITSSGTIRGAIAINAQTGTTYTVLTGDRGKLITHSNGSSIAVTLPQAGVSFPAGWFTYVQNLGAGTVTITPTTSTIDGATSLALTTNQGTIIVSDGTNYFTMRGVGTAGSGTVTSVATTSPITGGTITGSGTIACATCVTSAASLTSNLPVIGGGGQATAVGTRSGNTTQYVTTTGAQTSGDCVKIDANGNHVANGSACGSGGSGALTLIEQHTASASASLAFTNCFTSTYNNYLVVLEDFLPATNGVNLLLELSTDGGSTYLATNYSGGYWVWSSGGGGAGSVGTTSIKLATSQSNSSSNKRASGTIEFIYPLNTTNYKDVYSRVSGYDGVSHYTYLSNGTYTGATSAINAFRLSFSSGNITSGTAYCLGVEK